MNELLAKILVILLSTYVIPILGDSTLEFPHNSGQGIGFKL
jgi:hypothetical protein